MRVKSIRLKNIGVFKDELINFNKQSSKSKAEIHILTGPNGSGKSTILYARLNNVYTLSYFKRIKGLIALI